MQPARCTPASNLETQSLFSDWGEKKISNVSLDEEP